MTSADSKGGWSADNDLAGRLGAERDRPFGRSLGVEEDIEVFPLAVAEGDRVAGLGVVNGVVELFNRSDMMIGGAGGACDGKG
jgi:hypothetical protein